MRLRTILFIALTTLILSACSFSLAADITPPPGYVPPSPVPTLGPLYPAEAPNTQNGQNIYTAKCLACHGEKGLGDGPQNKQLPVPVAALGLPEMARPASPARWFTVVSQGNIERYMPPFTSLSEKDRWDVVYYALSMHITPAMLEEGKSLFENKCPDCSLKLFTDQQKMAALSEDDLANLVRKGGEGITTFGADLSDDQVYAVAAYLRSLSFAAPAPATATPTSLPATEAPAAGASGTPGAVTTPAQGTPQAAATGGVTTPVEGTPPATAAAGGTVTGKVTSRSRTPLPANLAITLHGYDHAQDTSTGPQETVTLQGIVAPDGSYTFENVDLVEGRIFLAETEYEGVTYKSAFKAVEAGASQVALDPITVYETTEDFKGLSLDQLHIAFDFGTSETVQVFAIYSFSNKSDQAVILKTDGSSVPFIAVPEGAKDTGYEAGQDSASFAPSKDGLAILPSDQPYSIIAFFTLPFSSKGTTIAQPLLLKADSVTVFVPDGVKLKADKLTDAGVQNISGSDFHMYSTEALPANSELSFTLSGKPKTTASSATGEQSSQRQALIYGAGALGLVLIGLGVWMYMRDRNMRAVEAEGASADENEYEDPESVLDAIIALDDLHRAKKIPDEAYQVRRAELKEQLRRLESGEE